MALVLGEKRQFPRILWHAPIHYQIRGRPEFNNVVSDDISSGGLRFVTDNFIPPGTLLMLEINLLSQMLRPLGKTIWSQPIPHSDRYSTGIEFQELGLKEKDYLKDFINMQLGKI
jgi:hypothetical protein